MNPIFDAIFDNGMIEFSMFDARKSMGWEKRDHTDRFSMPHKKWMDESRDEFVLLLIQ